MKRSGFVTSSILAAALAVSTNLQGAVIADWTFETSAPTTSGSPAGFAPEIGIGIGGAFIHHSGGSPTYSSPTGNGSNHSFMSTAWTGANVSGDYYQFALNLAGFNGIGLSFDQIGSSTGPGHFKVQISTSAVPAYTDIAPGLITGNGTSASTPYYYVINNASPNTWTSTVAVTASTYTVNLSSYGSGIQGIRLLDFDTTSVVGGVTASTGTDRLDNVTFSAAAGISLTSVGTPTGGQNLAVLSGGANQYASDVKKLIAPLNAGTIGISDIGQNGEVTTGTEVLLWLTSTTGDTDVMMKAALAANAGGASIFTAADAVGDADAANLFSTYTTLAAGQSLGAPTLLLRFPNGGDGLTGGHYNDYFNFALPAGDSLAAVAAVPEPASLGMLALGAGMLLRRRLVRNGVR